MRLEFDLPHNVPPLEVAAGYRLIFRGTTIRFRQLIGRTDPKGRLDPCGGKKIGPSQKILSVATSDRMAGLRTAAAGRFFLLRGGIPGALAVRMSMATASNMNV
jgi:hypothetical protein